MIEVRTEDLTTSIGAALISKTGGKTLEAILANYAEKVLGDLERTRTETIRIAEKQVPGVGFAIDPDKMLELFIEYLRGKEYEEPFPK